VTFPRKLDVKRLRATLSKTMREAMKDPSPKGTLARPESILIEAAKTTVFLSGDSAGLGAVAAALRRTVPDATVSRASRKDATRPPARMGRSRAPNPRARRRR
jgi:hypothetical protein